jgi:hypothetical protein
LIQLNEKRYRKCHIRKKSNVRVLSGTAVYLKKLSKRAPPEHLPRHNRPVAKACLPKLRRIALGDPKLIAGIESLRKDRLQLCKHVTEDKAELGEVAPVVRVLVKQALLPLLQPGLAIKKPTQKNPPKKPTKNVYVFLIFYENNKKNFSLKPIFYEQIRHKLSFIYKTIVRCALN